MKKILVLIGVSVVIGIGMFFIKNDNFGAISYASTYINGNSASTSPTYLTSATTTLTSLDISGAQSLEMALQLTASTTASNLRFVVEYSDDGIDWYTETGQSISSVTATESNLFHTWTPADSSASTTMGVIRFNNIGMKYMRLKASSQGANSALWGEVILNKEF